MSFFKEIIFEPLPKLIARTGDVKYWFVATSEDLIMMVVCPNCKNSYAFSTVSGERMKEVNQGIRDFPKHFKSEFESNCPNVGSHKPIFEENIFYVNNENHKLAIRDSHYKEQNIINFKYWIVGSDKNRSVYVQCPKCAHTYLFFSVYKNEKSTEHDLRMFKQHYYFKAIQQCPDSLNHED